VSKDEWRKVSKVFTDWSDERFEAEWRKFRNGRRRFLRFGRVH